MNDFERCNVIGAKGVGLLVDYLRNLDGVGGVIYQGNDGREWTVEVKTEQEYRRPATLFIEEISNETLGRREDYFGNLPRKPGWFNDPKFRCDLIAFVFLDRELCILLDYWRLKRWLQFPQDDKHLLIDSLPIGKTRGPGPNRTWGRSLPLAALRRSKIPLLSFYPRQPDFNFARDPIAEIERAERGRFGIAGAGR
jgi:hypothetical protein